jgi:hypothetical protein
VTVAAAPASPRFWGGGSVGFLAAAVGFGLGFSLGFSFFAGASGAGAPGGGSSGVCAKALAVSISKLARIDMGRRTFIPALSLFGFDFSGHFGVRLPDGLFRVR